jgi:hypothetical protein
MKEEMREIGKGRKPVATTTDPGKTYVLQGQPDVAAL